MGSIFSLLVVVVIMFAVVRGATVALISTGMSRRDARFQAVSALTGAGFTTAESERVVRHPERRHIVFTLIVLGGFGMVTAMSSLVLSFVDMAPDPLIVAERIAVLVGAALVIWCSTHVPPIDRAATRVILWMFRVCLKIGSAEESSVAQLGADHCVHELQLGNGSFLIGTPIEAIEEESGLKVLGVFRSDGAFQGASENVAFEEHDRLVAYGSTERIQKASDVLLA